VRLRSGPLAGTEGILLRKKDKFRLVISLEVLIRSIAVEVDAGVIPGSDLAPAGLASQAESCRNEMGIDCTRTGGVGCVRKSSRNFSRGRLSDRLTTPGLRMRRMPTPTEN